MSSDILGAVGGLLGGGGGSIMGLFDPGAVVHKALDSILPPELQFISGIAGAVTDYQCGNPVGALKEGMSVMSDLQDVSQQRQAAGGSAAAPPSWSYEPEPPPHLASRQPPPPAAVSGQKNGQLVAHPNGALAPSTTPESSASSGWRGTPPASSGSAGWRQPQSSLVAKPPTNASSPDHAAQASSVLKGLFDITPAGILFNALQGTKPSADPSAMGKDQFMKLSDKDFMNAIADGKIPKEITDDPAAMMALQKRMQHITEMNQLMTQMLQAIHQMRTSIIQNLRV